MNSKDESRRPQFISVLPPCSMEKMLIPTMFVQHYIPKGHLGNRTAIVIGPLGKVCPIELEMNRLDLFFTGVWSQFLASHDITEADALLIRYEGNMVFTVKVFGPNGCKRESKHEEIKFRRTLPGIEKQHKTSSASVWKCDGARS
uniref:TF-B3 domain-containing protein n=1 Tax=Arundo donax TaxID=35708 RepID=A0A0A9DVP2_ARUDO